MESGPRKPSRSSELRDLAVLAVMRGGRLESSGEAKLAILREEGLMIAYRTPFNPLPEGACALRDDIAIHGPNLGAEPYAIDVWEQGVGKVLSLGWRHGGSAITALYKPGKWEVSLSNVARRAAALGRVERDRLESNPRLALLRPVRSAAKGERRRGATAASPKRHCE